MNLLLVYTAILLYCAATGWLIAALMRSHSASLRGADTLGFLAAVLHAAVHIGIWQRFSWIDLHFFAALSLVGLGTALLTSFSNFTGGIRALGIVSYPMAALLLLLYRFAHAAPATPPIVDWQIQLHAALSLLAYAALSIAALLAIMLWLQERALRQRRIGPLLHALPPLTSIETLMFRQVFAGFALLSFALLAGLVFVQNLFAQHLVHKTVLSLLAWGIFGTLLYGRIRHGWRGRRAVHLTLTATVLLGLAFFGSKFVLELILNRA